MGRFLRNKNFNSDEEIQVDRHIGTSYDTVRAVYEALSYLIPLGQKVIDGELDDLLETADIDTLAELNAILTDATLGDASDFATAAQGVLADSALQPAAIDSLAKLNTLVLDATLASQAYVDSAVAGLYDPKGGYAADTNTPDLDVSPSGVLKGDAYTVTTSGLFFTAQVDPGDLLLAEQDNPTQESHWTIVNRNIDESAFATAAQGTLADSAIQPGDIDTLAELNAIIADATLGDAADFATAAQGALADSALQPGDNISGLTNDSGFTDDQTPAEIKTAFDSVVAAASQAEMEAGTEVNVRQMTPQRVAQAIAALAPGGGATTLDGLTDVDTDKSKTPADGDVLTFDGTHWNAEASAGGGGGLADGTTDRDRPVWDMTVSSLTRSGWSVDASTTYGSDTAAKAVDGNMSTHWHSDNGTGHWWRADMGASTFVSGVRVWPRISWNQCNVVIEYSNNNIDWTQAGAGFYIDNTANEVGEDWTGISARYWRIRSTRVDSHYLNFFEIYFYTTANQWLYEVLTLKELSGAATKGEVIGFDGSAHDLLSVGDDGQALIADSTAALGITWGVPSGGVDPVAPPQDQTQGDVLYLETAHPNLDQTGWVVTVDSIYSGSGANLIDGNLGTSWHSNSGTGHWAAFDMLTPQTVGVMKLYPKNNWNLCNAVVEYSSDGTNWTTHSDSFYISRTEAWITVNLWSNKSARYWRVRSIDGTYVDWYEIDFAKGNSWEAVAPTLDLMSDVDTDKSKTPADGDILTYDGTDWNAETPAPPASGGMTALYKDVNYTLQADELVYSEAGLTHTLPDTPSDGDKCSVWDVSDNAGSNFITVARGNGPGDPSFANVEMLLHMDGVDASTTFTDDSTTGRTVTANGNAQIDTAQKKWGTASGLFDGTGDYLSTPYVTADFDWWTGDYTIEAWVYANSWTDWDATGQASTPPRLCGNKNPTTGSNYWSFGPTAGGGVGLYYWNGAIVTLYSANGILPIGQWNHIAMSCNGTTIEIFANGSRVATAAISGTPQSSVAEDFLIGVGYNGGITGWADDFRITKGTQRYTGTTYTVPTEAFPNAAATQTQIMGLDQDFSLNMNGGRVDFLYDNTLGYWFYSYVVQTIQPSTEVTRVYRDTVYASEIRVFDAVASTAGTGNELYHSVYYEPTVTRQANLFFNVPTAWTPTGRARFRVIWNPHSSTDTGGVKWVVQSAMVPEGTLLDWASIPNQVYFGANITAAPGVAYANSMTDWSIWKTFHAGADSDHVLYINLYRSVADPADTFTGNAHVIAVEMEIEYTESLVAAVSNNPSVSYNEQTGTTYTIQASDNGKEILFTNGSAIAVTLPDGLPQNFQCVITQAGAGVPTVTPATDTINGAGTGVTPSAQWKGMHLGKYSATAWVAKF